MAKIDEKVIARMKELAPLNFDLCDKIAKEFGLKQRAIVASAVRNEIEYTKKARVSKTGDPVVSKADLVSVIAENLGLDCKALDGLEKSTKNALQAIASATEVDDETEPDC